MIKKLIASPIVAILLSVGGSATLLAYPAVAHADERSEWEIQSRIRHAHERIEWNLGKGRISRGEAYRLKRELNNILDTEDRMRRDGRLDRRERDILDRKLDRLNRDIDIDKRY